MSRKTLFIMGLSALLCAACASRGTKGTIAELANMRVEIKEEKIEGGLDKAMESYRRFLEEAGDSALAPEAIRRLADLKVEKEYGYTSSGAEAGEEVGAGEKRAVTDKGAPLAGMAAPSTVSPDKVAAGQPPAKAQAAGESDADFEKRVTAFTPLPAGPGDRGEEPLPGGVDDLERAGPLEAIELYKKLLAEYPLYERNDQVLYQMSRAYEELGRPKEAMAVMDRLVREYPHSRYMDEVQFRRAEHFFTHRRYMDAEEAYLSVVNMGEGSFYYELCLYKLGWAFYKQELYEESLHRFIALLDYKVSVGYDFEQTEDEGEAKRVSDTFHVISLAFSNLGGADTVVDYFAKHGRRRYDDRVYSNLAEHYFVKRRYSDAVKTYDAFVTRNTFHQRSPNFHMRMIEINVAGGFPTLVIDSKKSFATNYGLKAEYWQHFEPEKRPEVLEFLKTNLKDLAHHYHALYQAKGREKDKGTNLGEALHWYREYLVSFPTGLESAEMNFQLAALLLENKSWAEAAVEYEKTAYGYEPHERSAEAGYATVFAHRKHLAQVAEDKKTPVKVNVVRTSLLFADTFPEHEKAPFVLGAAADDLFEMGDYKQALASAHKLIEKFPAAGTDILRPGWLVVGHASFELQLYSEAEAAYVKVLELLPAKDKSRQGLIDNLALSIYKQGEAANAEEDYQAAADHFLRVGVMAPSSKFHSTAEFDGATALIKLEAWSKAAEVLVAFRKTFPGHELQADVTKKMAFVYRKDGKLALAAAEFERIEKESQVEEIRREALLTAADLYEEAEDEEQALTVLRRYVSYFPRPAEPQLETRHRIAGLLKERDDLKGYHEELRQIVKIELAAGAERTDRTRYIGATSALVLAQLSYDDFVAIHLVKPFAQNLAKKKTQMKAATKRFNSLLDYGVGEVTAAATFYLGEIYANFSVSLIESERPEGLSPMELEEYELAIEEQAYPFEDRAISVHQSNMELITQGVYNSWVDKSLQKLAKLVPARYAKPEVEPAVVTSLTTFSYGYGQAVTAAPVPAAVPAAPGGEAEAAETSATPPVAEPATETPAATPETAGEEPGAVETSATPPAPEAAEEAEPEEVETATPAPPPVTEPAEETPAAGPETAGPEPEAVETVAPEPAEETPATTSEDAGEEPEVAEPTPATPFEAEPAGEEAPAAGPETAAPESEEDETVAPVPAEETPVTTTEDAGEVPEVADEPTPTTPTESEPAGEEAPPAASPETAAPEPEEDETVAPVPAEEAPVTTSEGTGEEPEVAEPAEPTVTPQETDGADQDGQGTPSNGGGE